MDVLTRDWECDTACCDGAGCSYCAPTVRAERAEELQRGAATRLRQVFFDQLQLGDRIVPVPGLPAETIIKIRPHDPPTFWTKANRGRIEVYANVEWAWRKEPV